MKIHVSNLAPEVNEEDLRQAFAAFGEVTAVEIMRDRSSGRSKGAGIVEMLDDAQAEMAIQRLKRKNLKGNPLKIDYPKGYHVRRSAGGSRRHAGDRKGGARGGGRN
jgi:RNA recognition motif-containing protein